MDNSMGSSIFPLRDLSAKRHPIDLGAFCSGDQIHIYAATRTEYPTMLVPTNSPDVLGIRGLVFDMIGVQLEPACHQSDSSISSETWFTVVGHAQTTIFENISPQNLWMADGEQSRQISGHWEKV
jgi:hypothetical protein